MKKVASSKERVNEAIQMNRGTKIGKMIDLVDLLSTVKPV